MSLGLGFIQLTPVLVCACLLVWIASTVTVERPPAPSSSRVRPSLVEELAGWRMHLQSAVKRAQRSCALLLTWRVMVSGLPTASQEASSREAQCCRKDASQVLAGSAPTAAWAR